jgi:CspA family cold shock protein
LIERVYDFNKINLLRRKIMKQTGAIKWFNPEKGYGFVSTGNGSKDMFIHRSAVEAAKLNTLEENQKIEFDIEEKQGKTSAININLINN